MAWNTFHITKLVASCLTRHQQTVFLRLRSPTIVPPALACSYSNEAVPRARQTNSKYKVVIVGGGTGGCAVASKLSSLGKSCAVVEPSDVSNSVILPVGKKCDELIFKLSTHKKKYIVPTYYSSYF